MPDLSPVARALISVSDKTGLIDLAKALSARGVELLSTGGSAKAIREAGLKVRDVSDVTEFPEMMDGRVKTLHPRVHGGLLALRDNPAHVEAMEAHGITGIDLLVVNLYPFEETVAKGADYDTCIENIDIGGPAMIRAAAKNHAFVNVVTDVADYEALLAELDANDGATTYAFRQKLAQVAYARTGAYDAAVSTWMAGAIGEDTPRRREITRDALLFTLLTWVRTSETRFAARDEFEDLYGPNPLWRLSPERMKMEREHLVPLSRQAAMIVQRRLQATNDAFLFPGAKPGKSISENTMIYACYRMGYLHRQTVHGFRGLGSTWANEAERYKPDWIEMALAHEMVQHKRHLLSSARSIERRRQPSLRVAGPSPLRIEPARG